MIDDTWTGRVASSPFAMGPGPAFYVVVELDRPFWGEDRRLYVTQLVAHVSNLRGVAEPVF